jgi:hypothetical protein
MIKTLNKEYVQKSRIFLYPLLEIKRGSSVFPVQSYICWDGYYDFSDKKLICVWERKDTEDFKKFEKEKLLDNKLFETYYELEDNKSAYVFDLTKYKDDFDNFLTGRYSEISPFTKDKLIDFFSDKPSSKLHMTSYLYPERFYDNYSTLLAVPKKILREVGQLCSKPNPEKETLYVKVKDLEVFKVF